MTVRVKAEGFVFNVGDGADHLRYLHKKICVGDLVRVNLDDYELWRRVKGHYSDQILRGLQNVDEGFFTTSHGLKEIDRMGLVVKMAKGEEADSPEVAHVAMATQRGLVHTFSVDELDGQGRDNQVEKFMSMLGCDYKIFLEVLRQWKVDFYELLRGCKGLPC